MPDENILATIEPETREETFLQDIADGTQTLIPAVRKEEFLRRISAKPGVPSITESDEGKVLTVESGEAAWGEASSLPEITAQDEGKVLTVESGEAVWGEGGGGVSVYRPLTFEDFPLPEGGVCADSTPVFHYSIPSLGTDTSTSCQILVDGPGDFSPTFLIGSINPIAREQSFLEAFGVVDLKKASAAGLFPPFAPLSDDPTAGNVYMLTAKSADDIEFAAGSYAADTGFLNKGILVKNVDSLVWVRHQTQPI